MSTWTRREVLTTAVALPAVSMLRISRGEAGPSDLERPQPAPSPDPVAGRRERLLLDFGWRFHFGHAHDPSRDFGFGGASAGFQKTGNFLAPSSSAFADSAWTPVDLPHDWAIGLPFTNDPQLASKGSYPLGREYPETSVGWYRRVFDLPASDEGRRISLEFDGVCRDALVVVNGY